MLFSDIQGFTIRVGDLLAVVKCEGSEGWGIRYITTQGIQMLVPYGSQELQEKMYDRCVTLWAQEHHEEETFQKFMRAHAVKGAKFAEERAEDGKKGWE